MQDDSWDEFPEDGYADYDFDDDGEPTFPCPECGEEIFEESEQCPHCGHYIIRSTSPWEDKPTWWVALGAVGVLATVFALVLLG